MDLIKRCTADLALSIGTCLFGGLERDTNTNVDLAWCASIGKEGATLVRLATNKVDAEIEMCLAKTCVGADTMLRGTLIQDKALTFGIHPKIIPCPNTILAQLLIPTIQKVVTSKGLTPSLTSQV